jgi:acetyltransferase
MSLDKIFRPKSIALIGASDNSGSVGKILMKNLTESGYKGNVYPVSLNKSEILGIKAYTTVFQLPEIADLAIIAIPAKAVPDVVEQCGQAGIIGIIIISAGFKEIGKEKI